MRHTYVNLFIAYQFLMHACVQIRGKYNNNNNKNKKKTCYMTSALSSTIFFLKLPHSTKCKLT